MYEPTRIGILYGKYEFLKKMDTFITGGDMNDTSDKKFFLNILYRMKNLKLDL